MTGNFFNSGANRILASLALLMVILALGSYSMLNLEKMQYVDPMPTTINVTGEGEVMAVPDIGQFSFSVEAEGETATEAQEASGTKINAILEYLAERGIEDKDIKTEYYNLYPQWRYEERICPANSYCPPGERVQDGFTVSQSVTVKVRNTEEAGSVIAGVGERGATNISGLNFTIDDTDVLKSQARAEAIADAQAKAVVLAEQLGVRIVRMVGYYEESNYMPYYDTKVMAMDMAASEEGFGGANMPVGEEGTTARVNITFEVK